MTQHTMTREELLNLLTEEAKQYRRKALMSVERNRHMNNLSRADLLRLKAHRRLIRKMIDALLVDFINNVAAGQCIDYGLYVQHIKSKPADRT